MTLKNLHGRRHFVNLFSRIVTSQWLNTQINMDSESGAGCKTTYSLSESLSLNEILSECDYSNTTSSEEFESEARGIQRIYV